jgi:hypothetical protein
MPMNFLRRIEDASFPLAIREEADIQCAAVLVAARLVEANLLVPTAPRAAGRGGMILRITPEGRAGLDRTRGAPS